MTYAFARMPSASLSSILHGFGLQKRGKTARRRLLIIGGAGFGYLVALCGITLVVAVLLSQVLVVVHQGDVALVERLGQFQRRLDPGLHCITPFLCSVRWRGTTREQVLDIPPQGCITADNAPLKADAVVYWRITDPVKHVYELQDALLAIQNLILTQLRAEIGNLTLDETFSARSKVNQALLIEANEATAPWGVQITRVEVRDIIPNAEILKAMELQMAAERKKRAKVIESEGERLALVNAASGMADALKIEAESQKAAKILAAEAERERLTIESSGAAEALRTVIQAVNGDVDRGVQVQLLRSYIDAQAHIAASPNAKVLLFPSTDDWLAKASTLLGDLNAGAASAQARS